MDRVLDVCSVDMSIVAGSHVISGFLKHSRKAGAAVKGSCFPDFTL
jgi:hypothetical protein